MTYEYKVVPAPVRGLKAKGRKTPQDRFAHALELAMNDLAGDGWEYIRAETLPSEQREGFMSKTTVFQNLLVFRRIKAAVAVTPPPPQLAAPQPKTGEERLAEKLAQKAAAEVDAQTEVADAPEADKGKKPVSDPGVTVGQ